MVSSSLMAPWLSLLLLFFLLCGRMSTFNNRADVQEQFIASFVTVSGRRAVVGCFFVTKVVSCSCVVCVSELEIS